MLPKFSHISSPVVGVVLTAIDLSSAAAGTNSANSGAGSKRELEKISPVSKGLE
jgi:hypothetical protein